MTHILPTTARIADRAAELIATATRHGDTAAIAVLSRVCENIAKGAQLTWDMYDLHVTSANRPGAQYTVSCGVCDCPARKPCWHVGAYELALELLDEQAGDCDFELDADDEPLTPAPLHLSAYMTERLLTGPALARTAATLDTMRAQLGRRLCAAGRFAGA